LLPDLSTIPEESRKSAAWKLRNSKDFQLPELKYFNYSPCDKHETLDIKCLNCGVQPRKHQRVGIGWLYLVKKGLIGDSVGTGKTVQAAGLIAALKESGELARNRCLVICRPGAVPQWYSQLNRFLNEVNITVATGPKKKRIERYLAPWDVLLMGYQMLIRDADILTSAFNIGAIIVDDVDALRNFDTHTAVAINRIAKDAERAVVMSGTPLQKKLEDMHSYLSPIGGTDVLGSRNIFKKRFVREKLVSVVSEKGQSKISKKVDGYKNLDEFKELIAPMVLRRTADDIDDVDLPAIQPSNIFLDPYQAQLDKYAELKKGVLRIISEQGEQVKRATAIAKFLYGAQICTGLCAIGEPDLPGTSIKLDWLERTLVDGDLSDEKVVVFINFKNTIRALQDRLDSQGVEYETIWGEVTNKQARFEAQDRFWRDDNKRILIGTTAIEQSLNLQIARHLVNVDMILNPARMEQLAGRIRRDGSAYKTVYVHNLLTSGTQEEGYLPLLEREQALIDHIWDAKSELFEALPPLALLQLIGNTRSNNF
jgi:SNF2 family DNA or RNA helicase